jgi:hypothetical protein
MNKIIKPNFNLEKIIFRLAELGLDEEEISFSLGLKKREFGKMKEKKEISSALSKGLESCARKVEQALYRRAVGFEYEETVTSEKPEKISRRTEKSEPESDKNTEGNLSKSSSRLAHKTVIPDVTACIFWLKNRMPDKWRDPKDIESKGKKSIQDLVEEYEAKGFEEDD